MHKIKLPMAVVLGLSMTMASGYPLAIAYAETEGQFITSLGDDPDKSVKPKQDGSSESVSGTGGAGTQKPQEQGEASPTEPGAPDGNGGTEEPHALENAAGPVEPEPEPEPEKEASAGKWIYENGYYYFTGADGKNKTGVVRCPDRTETKSNGTIVEIKNGDTAGTYIFDSTGKMLTGWKADGSDWYYLTQESDAKDSYSLGRAVTGFRTADGKVYHFDANGKMTVGWFKDTDGSWYWFRTETVANGALKGEMATGWQKIGGTWFKFGSDGKMLTGWQKDGDAWYWLEKPGTEYTEGSMAIGWRDIAGKWYYFNTDGKMCTGWLCWNDKWYYFGPDGAMKTGWHQEANGNWYYFNTDGKMHTGWLQSGSDWYYMDSNGIMMKNSWDPTNMYYLGSDGKMLKNTTAPDGRKLAGDGRATTTLYVPKPGSGTERVLNAAKSIPSPGGGMCAKWVEQVFDSAGYGYEWEDANGLYDRFCHTSDRSQLKPGMIIAVSSHPHTSAGRIYGHVGIYIGNNKVMDNVGNIRTSSLDEWINYYGSQGEGTVPAQWGWYGDKPLD